MLYAQACAFGAAIGTGLAIAIWTVLRSGMPLAVLTSAGFSVGALLGPIVGRILYPPPDRATEPEVSQQWEPPPSAVEPGGTRASRYAFAAVLGSLVGCVIAVTLSLLLHPGPLALCTTVGFVLGITGGIVFQALFGA